jgi:hypothetical protein
VRATGELRAYDVSTASKTATLVPNSIYDQVLPSINGKPAGFDQPSGLAFDKTGHLWVANQPSNLVFSFTIHAPGVAPTLNLNSALTLPDPTPYNGGPVEMAYDPITNSVWTAGGQGLFDCAIGPSGALTLVPVTVSGNSTSNSQLSGMSFDRKGVLWLGGQVLKVAADGKLVHEPVAQLPLGGTPVFDAANNLWFADFAETPQANVPPKVYEYVNPGVTGAAPKLLKSFQVLPPERPRTRFVYPIGFDPQGNLWLQVFDQNFNTNSNALGLLAYSVAGTPKLLTAIPLPLTYEGGFYEFAFQPQ